MSGKLTDIVLAIIAIIFGALRLVVQPRLSIPTVEGSYEAFVHLFVGGLIGAWLVKRDKWIWLVIAIVISLLEVIVFTVQKSA
jgi:hypothetical protein